MVFLSPSHKCLIPRPVKFIHRLIRATESNSIVYKVFPTFRRYAFFFVNADRTTVVSVTTRSLAGVNRSDDFAFFLVFAVGTMTRSVLFSFNPWKRRLSFLLKTRPESESHHFTPHGKLYSGTELVPFCALNCQCTREIVEITKFTYLKSVQVNILDINW